MGDFFSWNWSFLGELNVFDDISFLEQGNGWNPLPFYKKSNPPPQFLLLLPCQY